ncbi:MAG: [FeFe] hydrogenase H-cluster radical SAM maturase HydG [bacterium]|nr:[FeFe] hydrogenase H-cluster radical SAM maturase HydG [bacterium]
MIDRNAILGWLLEADEARLAELWSAADDTRHRAVGDAVHLRGLVEVSNHCVRACAYCGLRAARDELPRYRMSVDEVLDCAHQAVFLGYGTVVLQAGEDPGLTAALVESMVCRIKAETGLAVTLSLGEREDEELVRWRAAGADRYLLRFETSNRELYARIHPARPGRAAADRLSLLRRLRALGYETGSGVMVGIPGQTWDDLAGDLLLMRELDLDMIGIGPYLAHPETPLSVAAPAATDQVPADELTTLKAVALARLLCPGANIPSTTALATIDRAQGRELGLQRGANVVMPNLTPLRYRELYEIYPGKACVNETAEACAACLEKRITTLGRSLGSGRGDAQVDFIDDTRLEALLSASGAEPDAVEVRDAIARSLAKEALSVEQTAVLLRARDPALRAEVMAAARQLKETVYGNRIVLFAPLYVGNECVNDCAYCGFRSSNLEAVRATLDRDQLRRQVAALEREGHKRLILVYGEHPGYDPAFIADSVREVYATRDGRGEIRRVNINAAPFDVDGFRTIREAGIGTYQVFQETYHHGTYARVHPRGTRKGDYRWRLSALDRAMMAGCDDVGLGALFGLHDWRFETLGLVRHALHLQERFGVGPHTISFPRLRPASGVTLDGLPLVGDDDFLYLVAVLRLAVPYTGLILTAREDAALRRAALALGVSQIDAGTRLELGAYDEPVLAQPCLERGQFALGDARSLDEVMHELVQDGYLPSFCTACYRQGRTGEHFMEFAVPGFIKRFCTPNALTTLQEYLCDFASADTRAAGEALVAQQAAALPTEVGERLRRIREDGERDLYY